MASRDFSETIRNIIKLCINLEKTLAQTSEKTEASEIKPSMSKVLMFEWHKRFCEGRESTEDDKGRG